MSKTHRDLWPGIHLKLDNARFHLERMAHALRDPDPTPQNLALMASTGANFDHTRNWHREFYAHLDAFLSAAHSVPEIIRHCFGTDHKAWHWLKERSADEQDRRQRFDAKFRPHLVSFGEMALSNARDISEHRTGFPPVTVRISGRFGITYIGDPVTRLPVSKSPTGDAGSAGFLPSAVAIRPRWTDFSIDGRPLFDECRSYVEQAQALIDRAYALAEEEHGDHQLTPPPNDL